jgi:hypothetical protein
MNKQEWDINTCRYWDMEIGCVRDVCRREQEEPKKTLEKYSERFDNKENELVEGVFNPDTWGKRIIEEPKQETLEEVNWKVLGTKDDSFYNGAKWQQERSYSEEEVRNIVEQTIEKFYKHRYVETKSEMKELWFEQFKKK